MKHHLQATKRFFRPTWGRVYSQSADAEVNNASREIAKKADTALLSLLAYGLFCALSLFGTPDSALIDSDPRVSMPFTGTAISFTGFLIVGPIILLALVFYLHMLLEDLKHLSVRADVHPASLGVIRMPYWPSRLFVHATAYWLAPVALALFYWKAMLYDESILLLMVLALSALVLSCLYVRRVEHSRIALVCGLSILATSIILLILTATASDEARGYVDDNGFSWRRAPRKTDFSFVDLSNRVITGHRLQEANLSFANLKNTRLVGANIANSKLYYTNLRGADLSRANVVGAEVKEADFEGAILKFARVGYIDLRSAKNLTQQQLNESCVIADGLKLPSHLSIPETSDPFCQSIVGR